MFWLLLACSSDLSTSSKQSYSDTAASTENEDQPELGCFSTPPEEEAQQVLAAQAQCGGGVRGGDCSRGSS